MDKYTVVKHLILPKLTNTLNSLSIKKKRFLAAGTAANTRTYNVLKFTGKSNYVAILKKI